MAEFTLNTRSGMLHMDEHGGTENAETFERADAADVYARDNGLSMTFCRTCFPGNKNTVEADELEALEDEVNAGATGSPTENTTPAGTGPTMTGNTYRGTGA